MTPSPDEYCPQCDEPLEPIAPAADGGKRWCCDNCGIWRDPPTSP